MDSPAWNRLLATHTQNQAAKWIRRMRGQIEFLAALGTHADLVAQAEALCANSDKDLEALCHEVEAILAPAKKEVKAFKIHCVGHGHIDMNWMWSWPETTATTHDTFASVLSLMQAYPDFTYSQSQTSVYELIDRYHPRMAEEIGARIKEGRWEVTAAQWVEGDKNIAQGEAMSRSYLYTRRWFQDRYGLKPEDVPVQWEPDTFGHANTIPTIAKLGGVKFYYACRTGGGFDHDGENRPPLFWWEGPDGSRILVNREMSWYNSYVNIGDNIALPAAEFFKQTGLKHWLNVYGIGNHGGGPTRKEIDYYLEMQGWPVYPTIVFSTAKAYFEAAETAPDLPVLAHELNFEFTGCYTSQSLIKEANRLGENQCLDAEAILAMGQLAGLKTRSVKEIEPAWRNVLFNQFHDILPGSGVRATREHARGIFQETTAITAALRRETMLDMCEQIKTAPVKGKGAQGDFEAGPGLGAGISGLSMPSGGGTDSKPIVVFNQLCWSRTDAVQVSLWDTGFDPHSIVAVDPEGIAHPTFFVEQKEDWGHDKIVVTFYAQDVPGLGYKLYRFREGTPNDDGARLEISNHGRVTTPNSTVAFDRYQSGVSFEGWRLGVARQTVETAKYMTAWVLGGAEKPEDLVPHRFDLRGESRNVATLQASGRNILATGTHRMKVFGSSLTQRTMIHSQLPRIDFEVDLDWREIGTQERGIPGLLIGFDLGLEGEASLKRQTPYGSLETSDDESPTLGYFHVGPGCTILTETKSAFRRRGSGIEMRVIRSSFDPDHAPEVNQQTFRFAVMHSEGEPTASQLNRWAKEWQHPMVAVGATEHKGTWPASQGFADGEIESIKPAEDGKGLIVTLVEHDGVNAERELRVGSLTKGVRVDWMERPLGAVAEPAIGRFRLAPHEVVNLRVT